jgi:serine/threonine-protein kinase
MAQAACPECQGPLDESARFCTGCGAAIAPAAPPLDPLLGAVVNGKFRVEALIGQGGMGRVYRARHLTLDRAVVLKLLHKAYSTDPQIVQRFQREARAASRLDHPNSIAVLDFGEAEDGSLFMAMEYLSGRDLGRVLSEDFPLGEDRIVRIGAQVLSALAEAHAQGVIHRDLKPENVMVEPRRGNPDFVKVLDFGIAKIVDAAESDPKLTGVGLVCGTPEYMSPEQARGAPLDARSDLYSMGVLLYHLCTGELPFHSDTPVGFLTAHLSEIPVPVRQRRPNLDYSPALDALVSRALEKDPARRFADAEEMRAALLGCGAEAARAAAVPEAARAAAVPEAAITTRRPRSRKPFWGFVAAMVLALLGGGAIVLLVKKGPQERNFAREQDGKTVATQAAPSARPEPLPPPAQPEPARPPAPAPTEPAKAPVHDPAKAAALFQKAEERRGHEQVDAAIPLYLQALEADPSLADAQKKLGLCYQLKGDRKRAAERYRRYLATNPPDADRVRAILGTLE